LFLNISLKKRALQVGLPRDIDGPMKIQMASSDSIPAASINYYKQVEACVRTMNRASIDEYGRSISLDSSESSLPRQFFGASQSDFVKTPDAGVKRGI
jgi:hypothetical protein